MVNVILIVISIVMFVAVTAASLYVLVYFQHEADRNTAIFPKIVVVAGLTLTCISILMLPLDVANARTNGGFPMEDLWMAIYIIMGVLIVGLVPFAIFFYEAEDPSISDNGKQIVAAIKYEVATLGIFLVLTILLWLGIGTAEIPVHELKAGWQDAAETLQCNNCTSNATRMPYQVSLVLYIISILTFIGMFLFVIFGGIGMAALPFDLLISFKNRPTFMTLEEQVAKNVPSNQLNRYTERKILVGRRASELHEIGGRLKEKFKKNGGRPNGRRERAGYNKFRAVKIIYSKLTTQNVFILEEDYVKLEKAYNKGIGPKVIQIAWSYCQLVLGVFGIFVSSLWVIHIFLWLVVYPPASPFLNTMFIDLDRTFGLFGTVAYGCFAFYLLWAVIIGNFKFGLRVPLLFTIHPMKVGETLMNSFLFNILLILCSSITVTQFCSINFSLYNRLTGIDSLFNIGVRNLTFFRWFWYYYHFAFAAIAILSTIYFAKFPFENAKRKKQADLA